VRPRDPRRLLERRRRASARVQIVPVRQSDVGPDGSVGSRQVAEVTLPRPELERIWTPEHLERLARSYWIFLSRVSLGILRVLYTPTSREVVAFARPFVLLRFHAPVYDVRPDGGTVTWPIDRGLLVARAGRGRGYLRLSVERVEEAPGPDATVTLSSEVVNFYPAIAAGVGGWIYNQTQQRIHVILTNAFLRSLANLELQPSRVGALSAGTRPEAEPQTG
jgi:hypothetical protein